MAPATCGFVGAFRRLHESWLGGQVTGEGPQAGGVPLRQEDSAGSLQVSMGGGGVTPGAAGGNREDLRGVLWECCVCVQVCVHT